MTTFATLDVEQFNRQHQHDMDHAVRIANEIVTAWNKEPRTILQFDYNLVGTPLHITRRHIDLVGMLLHSSHFNSDIKYINRNGQYRIKISVYR